MDLLCRCAGIVWETTHTRLVREHSATVVSARWTTVDWSWPKEGRISVRDLISTVKRKALARMNCRTFSRNSRTRGQNHHHQSHHHHHHHVLLLLLLLLLLQSRIIEVRMLSRSWCWLRYDQIWQNHALLILPLTILMLILRTLVMVTAVRMKLSAAAVGDDRWWWF